ncbi:MAG: CPBP family intramembrane metalloprotease [Coriobacteriia bacterium]|nr:CPBP family intramembrane metalloprotease [Coriobacteriia bacterium]
MTQKAASSGTARIQPTVAVGVGVWIAYSIITNGLQATSGIPFADWFTSSGAAFRNGVLPLAVSSVFLLVFVLWARWDATWRDPIRLQTTMLMKIMIGLFVAMIVARVAAADYAALKMDLITMMVLTGVLVGFAEETLFRVIFLRTMREGGRREGVAAVITAVCFGVFHLPNAFLGGGWGTLMQIVLATLTGSTLYLFRRQFGVIWPAMIAHGLWDISAFMIQNGQPAGWLSPLTLVSTFGVPFLSLWILISLWRTDHTVLLPASVETPASAQ